MMSLVRCSSVAFLALSLSLSAFACSSRSTTADTAAADEESKAGETDVEGSKADQEKTNGSATDDGRAGGDNEDDGEAGGGPKDGGPKDSNPKDGGPKDDKPAGQKLDPQKPLSSLSDSDAKALCQDVAKRMASGDADKIRKGGCAHGAAVVTFLQKQFGRPRNTVVVECQSSYDSCLALPNTTSGPQCDSALAVTCPGTVGDYTKCADEIPAFYAAQGEGFSCEKAYDSTSFASLPKSCDFLQQCKRPAR